MTTWEPKINGNEERGGARPLPEPARRSARGLSPRAAGAPGAPGEQQGVGWGRGLLSGSPVPGGVTGQARAQLEALGGFVLWGRGTGGLCLGNEAKESL